MSVFQQICQQGHHSYHRLIGLFASVLLALVIPLEAATDDRTLHQLADFQLGSLDPIYQRLDDDNLIHLHLFEGLTTTEIENKLVPGQANYWDVSDDGRRYTFFLRHGLQWSDGHPVTAEQFVAQFHRLFALSAPSAQPLPTPTAVYRHIVNAEAVLAGKLPVSALGVKALDAMTLEVELTQADAEFLYHLQQPVLAPLPTHLLAKYGEDWAKPEHLVSNGPYQLQTIDQQAKTVTFAKNPYHHNAVNLHYQTVVLQPLAETEQAVADLLAGRVDLWRQLPAAALNQLQASAPSSASPAFNLVEDRVSTAYLRVNSAHASLQSPQLRQALSMLSERSVFPQQLPGAVTPAFAMTPGNPTLGWDSWQPSWANESAAQRRQATAAVAVMAQSVPDLEILHADTLSPAVRKALAQALLEPWQVLGIRGQLVPLPETVLQQRLATGDYQLVFQQWHSRKGEDPAPFTALLSADQDFAVEIAALQDAELDQQALFRLYQRFEEQLATTVPLIPLYFSREYSALTPKLMFSDETHMQSLLPAVIAPAF